MKNDHLTDYELVEEFVSGSYAAIETLISRHRKKVFTYILLVVRNRELAEDIFQDTFIKVIHSLRQGRYEDNGRFVSWVTRIAHNLIIDYFRKEKQLNTISNDNYEADIFNTSKLSDRNIEEQIVKDQVYSDIRKLIDELPQDQREVIVLRHYIGLSFKEIAEHTNVSINTALGRMRYALINLRRLVEEKNISLKLN
jgi:RNA polymerase sigma factor (sigma-70 family)